MGRALSRDDVAVALGVGVAGLAGNAAVTGIASDAFLVRRLDDALVAVTPDAVIRFSIQQLGTLGHQLFVLGAILTAISLLAIGGLLGQRFGIKMDASLLGIPATWLFTGGIAYVVTFSGLAALGVAAGSALAVTVNVGIAVLRGADANPVSMDRRQALAYVAGIGVLASVGSAAGVLRTRRDYERVGGATPQSMLSQAAASSFDIDGLDGLVTTRDAHYEVDINSIDPSVNADTHEIAITGAVDAETTVTMKELRAMETDHRYVTLRCVSDDLNGDTIDTAVWTGTPVNALLEAVEPSGDCECVMLHAEDGYYVQFPLDALRGGLLAYGMNGYEVPKGHGYPVRTLVPGHWGETNVKWLSEIEFLDEAVDGYWEKKGWKGTGAVETVAKIHVEDHRDDGTVLLAGPTYAGTRGIERVEVSTDGGDTWQDAELTEPLPGTDVWRQWRIELAIDEPTTVTARAVDGTGRVQPREESDSFPSGASGWVSVEVSP